MEATVVIPTYNERDNVPIIAVKVMEALPQGRILFVDDNSPDGTGKLIDELHGTHPEQIFALHRTDKAGLGAAYVAGYLYALEQWPDCPHFIQMDADLSHDTAYLPELLETAQATDVVVASRYVQGVSIVNWPLHRLITSKLGTAYAKIFTGLPITDCTGGFKCYRREVLEAMNLKSIRSNGYVFQIETSFRAWRMGYRLQDFPIIFYERQFGKSKLDLSIALETAWVTALLGMERLVKRPVLKAKPQPHEGV